MSIEYIELRKEDFLEMVDFDVGSHGSFENRSDYEKEEDGFVAYLSGVFHKKKSTRDQGSSLNIIPD